jgi:fumarate hydratase class II
MLVTALAPKIGYDHAAQVAHIALEKNLTLKEVCLELGYISSEEFDQIVNPYKMAYPDV